AAAMRRRSRNGKRIARRATPSPGSAATTRSFVRPSDAAAARSVSAGVVPCGTGTAATRPTSPVRKLCRSSTSLIEWLPRSSPVLFPSIATGALTERAHVYRTSDRRSLDVPGEPLERRGIGPIDDRLDAPLDVEDLRGRAQHEHAGMFGGLRREGLPGEQVGERRAGRPGRLARAERPVLALLHDALDVV